MSIRALLFIVAPALLAPAVIASSSCGAFHEDSVCEAAAGVDVPNEGWFHVAEGSSITYAHNPPASGAHYPSWVSYTAHDDVVPRGNWVHNLEHGAVVLVFNPDAPAARIAELRAIYDGIPDDLECGNKRALLTADPLLDLADHVAAIAADHIIVGDDVTSESVGDLVDRCRNTAPEDVCASGGRVPFLG